MVNIISRFSGRCFFIRIIPLLLLFGRSVPDAAPIAEGADKFLGNITSSRGGIPDNFTDYWNQVTPENEGKWGNVERRRNEMNWSGLSESFNFASTNKLPFKQHTLVWGYQEPSWISTLSEEEQRKEVEEWIKAYAEQFPDADYIDVVNEPINRPASYREALGGAGVTGIDWIVWVFKKAREYCPKAKLLINDYNIINHTVNVNNYLYIIKVLNDSGLIDGVGIQTHYFSLLDTAADTIAKNLDRLSACNLPIYVSEFDLIGNDEEQLAFYRQLFPIFWEHPAVVGVTIWGWLKDRTWAENSHLIDGTTERPALTWLREYVGEHLQTGTRPFSIARNAPSSPAVRIRNGMLSFSGSGITSVQCFDLSGRQVFTIDHRFPAQGNRSFMTAAERMAPGRYYGIVKGNGFQRSIGFTVAR